MPRMGRCCLRGSRRTRNFLVVIVFFPVVLWLLLTTAGVPPTELKSTTKPFTVAKPLRQEMTARWVSAQKYKEYIPRGFQFEGIINYNFSAMPRQEGNGFTFITMLHLFTGQKVRGYETESVESLVSRNFEYLTALRENINHSFVKKVILLYMDKRSLEVLLAQNWVNVTKVHVVKMKRLLHMADFFTYSSRYLIDEPAIAANGDIVIGENFEQINVQKMRKTKTLYSLTRHGNMGVGGCQASSMCNSSYRGSHDTHIFVLKEPISQSTLNKMDYPVNLQQAENGMIGAMVKEGFTVYNPCRVLITYHLHCSQIATELSNKYGGSVAHAPWFVTGVKYSMPVSVLRYGTSAAHIARKMFLPQ